MSEWEELWEKQESSETVYDGTILHVKKDTVILPNGNTAFREVIRHIGAVCVIPVTGDGEVIMERQYRYPLDAVISEIPAGKLDRKDEDRLEAAKRELREETGYTADSWTDLGFYYGAPAYTDEKITVFLAQGLHQGERELDDDEFLNVEKIPLKDLVDAVMEGRITDGKTIAAVLKAARYLGI